MTYIGKRIAVVLLVVVVAFVCGWTASGLWSGVGIAVALGIAAFLAIRAEDGGHPSCGSLRRRDGDSRMSRGSR